MLLNLRRTFPFGLGCVRYLGAQFSSLRYDKWLFDARLTRYEHQVKGLAVLHVDTTIHWEPRKRRLFLRHLRYYWRPKRLCTHILEKQWFKSTPNIFTGVAKRMLTQIMLHKFWSFVPPAPRLYRLNTICILAEDFKAMRSHLRVVGIFSCLHCVFHGQSVIFREFRGCLQSFNTWTARWPWRRTEWFSLWDCLACIFLVSEWFATLQTKDLFRAYLVFVECAKLSWMHLGESDRHTRSKVRIFHQFIDTFLRKMKLLDMRSRNSFKPLKDF